MINIIGAIISGLIIGALARFFYPGAVEMDGSRRSCSASAARCSLGW